jgi:hypothetical protein
MKKIYFEETQKFSQWWLWILLLIIFGFSVRPIWNAYQTGNKLSSDQIWGIGVLLVVILFLISIKLTTKLTEEGIYVQFFPIHFKPKFYAWNIISQKEVKKYSPLLDYGGWGIRFGRNGKAYNVKGNKGLQLFLKNGDGLLIGTQKEEDLKRAIQELQSKI